MTSHSTPLLSLVLCLGIAVSAPAQGAGGGEAGKAGKAAPAAADKAQEPARKPAAVPFAVVDMGQAASHTKAFRSGLATRAKMAEAYQKQLDAMKARIDSLKLEIEIMQPSPERMEKELERETLIGRHGLAGKMFKSELERQRVVNDDKIYVELRKAIAELARSRGILMVFRKRPHQTVQEMLNQKLVRSENEGIAQQVRANQQRNVVYHAPDLDLTEDLIKYLKK